MKDSLIVRDIRMPLGHSQLDLLRQIAKRCGQSSTAIQEQGFVVVRKSIDARRKSDIRLVYSVEIGKTTERLSGIRSLKIKVSSPPVDQPRPIVAGAGPAGLFAALFLAMAGQKPILIEQGRPVEQRQLDVERFWQTGELDPLSNVQFGEGGAGTFSDGKLTSGIKDARCRAVLEELVLAGAPEEILILPKPHVGTDRLREVVRNIRNKIIDLGGECRFETRLTGIHHQNGRLTGISVESSVDQEIPAVHLILAIGHSAHRTFEWLVGLPVEMVPKPFSIGVRIEHRQQLINSTQYGDFAGHPQLPPADYKLACHLPSGRSVYTFCMCPGGDVVASSSEPGGLVTNGMSHFARNRQNANSALLVGVNPDDFPESGPLGGFRWQQSIERAAYTLGGGGFIAPAQSVGDFLNPGSRQPAQSDSRVEPTYRPGVRFCDLDTILPGFIATSLREALPVFDQKIQGFSDPGAVLTGPETRSSSPLRLVRGTDFQSNLAGLYPCGEGSGYAGGIMSSAVDGLRCAQALVLQT